MASQFNSSAYYRLYTDEYGIGTRLNDGIGPDAPNALELGEGSYSSENWQVFYQDEVYFIRNYDYGAEYQLALNSSDTTQPQLLPATGDLTQQWNITSWSDGTWKLVNIGVEQDQYLSVTNTTTDQIIPAMNTDDEGSRWTFQINHSAGNASAEMLEPLSSVATVQTATSSTTAASSTATKQATPSSTSTSTNKSNSLSSGALAGTIVGAVAVIAFLVIAALLMVRKRSRARRRRTTEIPDPMLETSKYHAYSAPISELAATTSPTYIEKDGRATGTIGAVELPP
ncbi:hypothetical protein EDD36DRAFT_464163 [Exophiala viscosa]|uniref:Ricin B lectin domain-containing protein n=1 Tax=Exophiala viscosa TaxID=2486360 RepID=A0AAN6IGA5_9EURO|nr:hypothetical protein EDD36DRAFT_464163 [Exophiala viscosa]